MPRQFFGSRYFLTVAGTGFLAGGVLIGYALGFSAAHPFYQSTAFIAGVFCGPPALLAAVYVPRARTLLHSSPRSRHISS